MKKDVTRIMLFGTFDVLHKGHLNFFKQARGLAKNSFLIVSVARDSNVTKIKGKKPILHEQKRAQGVKKTKAVDKVVLGGQKSFIPHILKEKPQIIALGYDQTAYTKGLKQALADNGLKVQVKRLKPFKPHLYKSSILKHKKKMIY